MFLKKLPITSNASRNIKFVTLNFPFWKKISALGYTQSSRAGRTNSGKITCRTKTHIMKKRKININYNFRFKSFLFIGALKLLPFSNKLIALVYSSNGGLFFLPLTVKWKLFMFLYKKTQNINIRNFFPHPNFIWVFSLLNGQKVSFLELTPGRGIQYVRSSGTVATFIKLNIINHTAIFKLPSGVKKVISIYSYVSYGNVSLKEKRLIRNTRAGYWKNFGKKPLTRGVAKNPIDHPHGGRTKAIKYPRTPWGKTTKFK